MSHAEWLDVVANAAAWAMSIGCTLVILWKRL